MKKEYQKTINILINQLINQPTNTLITELELVSILEYVQQLEESSLDVFDSLYTGEFNDQA